MNADQPMDWYHILARRAAKYRYCPRRIIEGLIGKVRSRTSPHYGVNDKYGKAADGDFCPLYFGTSKPVSFVLCAICGTTVESLVLSPFEYMRRRVRSEFEEYDRDDEYRARVLADYKENRREFRGDVSYFIYRIRLQESWDGRIGYGHWDDEFNLTKAPILKGCCDSPICREVSGWLAGDSPEIEEASALRVAWKRPPAWQLQRLDAEWRKPYVLASYLDFKARHKQKKQSARLDVLAEGVMNG
jgi:hypothetical protein